MSAAPPTGTILRLTIEALVIVAAVVLTMVGAKREGKQE